MKKHCSILILLAAGLLAASGAVAQTQEASAHSHDAHPSETKPAVKEDSMDHSGMDHSGMDHSGMDHSGMDHSGMDHSGMDHSGNSEAEALPEITEADRLAAFPELEAHSMHSDALNYRVVIDHLEAWDASPGQGQSWDVMAWVGTDLQRLWLRSEGNRADTGLEHAELELFAGRSISPWWEFLAGVRHDFKPGKSQDFAAIGVMGLAPYKFETALTAYVGESGQTAFRAQFEYELLLSNRLILQPKLELNAYGKDDPERGIGSGLSDASFGLRLRYEIRRQFAPYIGISWEKSYGQTAAFARMAGEPAQGSQVLAGVRIWF